MRFITVTTCSACVLAFGLVAAGCSSPSAKSEQTAAARAQARPKLGIRPAGDTEIQPDLTKIPSDELKKVFTYIDEHIDDHVENLQKWIRQPSISNRAARAFPSRPRW
jgi:hypothetical protein